jgi:hypothetical protein
MSTKNVLNAPQVYKLTLWLKDHLEEAKTLHQEELACMAWDDLGFTITTANLVMAGKNLGIMVGKQNHVVQTKRTNDQILASAICDIYLQFGALIPENLKRLAK